MSRNSEMSFNKNHSHSHSNGRPCSRGKLNEQEAKVGKKCRKGKFSYSWSLGILMHIPLELRLLGSEKTFSPQKLNLLISQKTLIISKMLSPTREVKNTSLHCYTLIQISWAEM